MLTAAPVPTVSQIEALPTVTMLIDAAGEYWFTKYFA